MSLALKDQQLVLPLQVIGVRLLQRNFWNILSLISKLPDSYGLCLTYATSPRLRGTKLDYPYFPFRISVDFVLVSRSDDLSLQLHRTLFEKACRREGLIVHHEHAGPITFTLISAPFHRLCREAERLQMSFPLKDCPIHPAEPGCCKALSAVFVSRDTTDYISAPFQKKFAHLFLNYTDERKFFTDAQRALLTHQILTQIDISKDVEEMVEKDTKCQSQESSDSPFITEETLKRKGLEYLLMEKSYSDAFVLHHPSEVEPYFKRIREKKVMNFMDIIGEIEEDPRKDLAKDWCKWYKTQPLQGIRDYFGEQIAFYFAWQGTLLTLLWPAALLGLAAFFFGFIRSVQESPATVGNCTNINTAGVETIVPCRFYSSVSQVFSALSSWTMKAFDNESNAFFAIFMSIWGSLFYQIWKRNNSVLAYDWDTEDLQEIEPDRPEYRGNRRREDPITGETEFISTQTARYLKMFLSAVIVCLCMLIVVLSVFAVTFYKMWIIKTYECKSGCAFFTTYIPSFLNTVSTMVLGTIYGEIVEKLNNWENHRTRSEHNNALIVKLFAFQLVNNYTSLLYVAFIRPERHGFQENGLFGLGPDYRDVCIENTCGSLLAVQLMTHMLIKPLPKFCKDIIIPFFVQLYRESKWMRQEVNSLENILRESDETSVLSREWMKPDPGRFAFWEFNEKIILFGTTMMFAALFPLAPLIALLIGLTDLRIDAGRLVWFNRKPVPETAAGIGIWLPILSFIMYTAVMTNAFIIAFTSEFCVNFFSDQSCDLKMRLVIVIVFQNIVFVLKYLIQSIIPTVPASIRVAQRRRRYIVSHIIEKGDVPYKIRSRKRARRAKLAWITMRAGSKPSKTEPATSGAAP